MRAGTEQARTASMGHHMLRELDTRTNADGDRVTLLWNDEADALIATDPLAPFRQDRVLLREHVRRDLHALVHRAR